MSTSGSARAAPLIMLSAGEPSGDLYAGALVRALRDREPGLRAFGFGGAALRDAGADLVGDYRGVSVTGLVEALRVLPQSWRMLRRLRAEARARRPDVFIAVDFPDFNFRLLPAMQALGIPVVYYVSPQVWAWRPRRVETLRRYVRKMLVIFPFERTFYERAGVPVEFVGHPLIDLARASETRETFLPRVGLDPLAPVVALLPGSRPNEVHRLLPDLLGAVPRIRAAIPNAQFLIARAPSLDDALFSGVGAARAEGAAIGMAVHDTDHVLASADVVITASGTATVQTGLHGRPMVIVYRLSALTYALGRVFVRVPQYGMVNLVAGRPVVPELIQEACTPEAIAREVVALLTDPERVARMQRDLQAVREALGGPGASARAAAAVLSTLAR